MPAELWPIGCHLDSRATPPCKDGAEARPHCGTHHVWQVGKLDVSGEVIDYHKVISFVHFTDIGSHSLPASIWHRSRHEQLSVLSRYCHLAMFAVFDPLLQVFAKAWPPDALFGTLTAIHDAHVTIVQSFHYL